MHLSHNLVGRQLEGGWQVENKIIPPEGATGSNFSIGYRVTRGKEAAFLKVLDVNRALRSPDPARMLQHLTTAFNYERDLVLACAKMSRVVSALDEGTLREETDDGSVEVAQYIIFELADSDFRAKVQLSDNFDQAMALRALHGAAVGLNQLHKDGIAHQDLKPSNIMMFANEMSKVGDLGRSSRVDERAPHDDEPVAGDPAYTPPEGMYGYVAPDWSVRRFACDLYHLGSLILYIFAGYGASPLLVWYGEAQHLPQNWTGSFSEVLPYLRIYFARMLEAVKPAFPNRIADELTEVVRQLCEPDPAERGHPANHARKDPYGLDRYISILDRLAFTLELDLKKKLK